MMPLALRMYTLLSERVQAAGHHMRMVAARGPFATASWLVGPSDFLAGLLLHPEVSDHLLDVLTETTIRWLQAQLARIDDPQGVLLLDDIVGMLSMPTYERYAHDALTRIWDVFPDLIHVYHNDTPCPHLASGLADTGMDVWNFGANVELNRLRAEVGSEIALMGHVPPLDVLARGTPEMVYDYAGAILQLEGGQGPFILSAGGGVAPDTPDANIDALLQAAQDAG
jgi:uroporphyrinogen decarboxylase